MLPSVDGIRLKMQRAYQQIEALKGEINLFLEKGPYEPTLDIKRIGRTTDFTIRMIVKEPCEPMWSIVIGEILHDIRSALDHLVYQLVVYATDKAPPDNSRTQFPIFDEPAKFKVNSLKMLAGVGSQATALIKTLQPFSTGEGTKSPLWHLNQLSNIDKHRALHLTGGFMETFNFTLPPLLNPGRIVDKSVRERGAFEHNTVVASGRFLSDLPLFAEPVKVDAQISFHIVFDQRAAIGDDWSVIGTLLNIADRCRDCIATISKDVLSLEFVL